MDGAHFGDLEQSFPLRRAQIARDGYLALDAVEARGLEEAVYNRKRRLYPLLLAAGAGITGILRANDAYLRKVATMGFPRYEKAHRMRLTATCARVVFPRLPVDAVSHVVTFAFHTGYY